MPGYVRTRLFAVAALCLLILVPAVTTGASIARAQSVNCDLPAAPAPAGSAVATAPAAEVPTPPEGAPKVTIGYIGASIFAPIFVAKEKGYFAEAGIDVDLKLAASGAEMVTSTATGEYQAGIAGAGPGFWNAIASGLPITVIAPGHMEGDPVATPLMISKASCDDGTIKSVADLKGKKVSVNAPGATEYWLSQALATGGLTLDDVDLQYFQFADAIAALANGALDAAMIGEPLATAAEQQGVAVRLLTSFDVQSIQPTYIFANSDWVKDNPDAATALVTGYLKAARDLTNGGFSDPADLAAIEKYTGIPADLVAQAVPPVYPVDGNIDLASLNTLQTFFRERGQLEYDTDLDPSTFVNTQFVDAALEKLGPA